MSRKQNRSCEFVAGLLALIAVLWTPTAIAQSWFVEKTVEVGLGDYCAESGDSHGPGAVFADLDNDGYPDLYLMRAFGNPNELYHNVEGIGGARQFQAVPDQGGAGDGGDATGAIAGDYDNDGDLDLYVLNFDQPNVLFRNQLVETGQWVFIDVTAQTDPTPGVNDDQYGLGMAFYEGVALDNSLTAAWADVDRDGDLDLYVGNHNGNTFFVPEGPFNVAGRRDVFYINNGNGTFSDMTMAYGVPGYESANGEFMTFDQRFSSSNAVIFADFNNDRWPDLLVTNKIGGPTDRDMLYMNLGSSGDGTWLGFDLVTYDLVPTFGDMSGAAMGVDVADPDRDGDLDFYITDFSSVDDPLDSRNDLWVNQLAETGELSFVHCGEVGAQYSWGTQWQDFDNNGLQDLHVACEGPLPDYLYMNYSTGFAEEAEVASVAQQGNARGDLTADYNRDGWPDLFVVNRSTPSALYENRSFEVSPGRNFLVVKLLGDPESGRLRSTRDAIGARVNLVADVDDDGLITQSDVLIREVVSGSSNAASTSSLEIEYGLGPAVAPALEILWPSGRRSVLQVQENQFVLIDESVLNEADVNGDGSVGIVDLLAILGEWGPCPEPPALCPADITVDGNVGISDFLLVLANWTL